MLANTPDANPGVVGWSLAADLPKLEFLALAAREDESKLRAFVAAMPYQDALSKFAASMCRESIFVYSPFAGGIFL